MVAVDEDVDIPCVAFDELFPVPVASFSVFASVAGAVAAAVLAIASCSLCEPTSERVFGPIGKVSVRSSPALFAAFASSFCLRIEYCGGRHFPDGLFVGRNGLRTSLGVEDEGRNFAKRSFRNSFDWKF